MACYIPQKPRLPTVLTRLGHEVQVRLAKIVRVTKSGSVVYRAQKGEYLVRYFGWYSYRRRGMRAKNASTGEVKIDRRLVDEAGSAAKAKSSGTASSWATLVKRVFEVDPLQCPQCGSRMKVVSFIKRCQRDVVEKILRHCGWREGPLRMLATARSLPNAADLDRDA